MVNLQTPIISQGAISLYIIFDLHYYFLTKDTLKDLYGTNA